MSMVVLRVALYARVSSEQQTEQGTIASQVTALEAKIVEDGLHLEPDHRFIDEGYSGATLVRLSNVCGIGWPPGSSIGFMSIRQIGWLAVMPIKSC
jgi:hypothetical protein